MGVSMTETDNKSGKIKVEDLESLRAVLKSYKEYPKNIPLTEWKKLVSYFCEIIDEDVLPFDPNLASFCQCLVTSHVDDVEDICTECDLNKSSKKEDVEQWRDTLKELTLRDHTIEEMREILKPLTEEDICGYQDEKRSTSFNSFNVGMLYGIALGRILYEEDKDD